MEDNTFLEDEENNDFDNFFRTPSGKRYNPKLKAIKKSANMGKLKLKAHQKDDVLLGGMFSKIRSIGDKALATKKPNKYQATNIRNYRHLPPSLKSQILEIAKRRDAGRRISVADTELIKTVAGIPITNVRGRSPQRSCKSMASRIRLGKGISQAQWIKDCEAQRTSGTGFGKPRIFDVGNLSDMQKPVGKPKVNLGESPAEAELTSPEMDIDTTPQITVKKKPPYLLYGAIGVIGLLVAIKMFK